jgi:hypothetical protein
MEFLGLLQQCNTRRWIGVHAESQPSQSMQTEDCYQLDDIAHGQGDFDEALEGARSAVSFLRDQPLSQSEAQ